MCVRMSVHYVCAVPIEEEDGTWITDNHELPRGFWEWNPGPPQEQQVLLTVSHLSSP